MTKQNKFTPGPWKVETYHGSMFKIIRELDAGMIPERRLETDRRLIESAPDLYTAAMAALDLMGEWKVDKTEHRLRAAQAQVFDLLYFRFIRKAQGGAE